jgi:hypothetical protein
LVLIALPNASRGLTKKAFTGEASFQLRTSLGV